MTWRKPQHFSYFFPWNSYRRKILAVADVNVPLLFISGMPHGPPSRLHAMNFPTDIFDWATRNMAFFLLGPSAAPSWARHDYVLHCKSYGLKNLGIGLESKKVAAIWDDMHFAIFDCIAVNLCHGQRICDIFPASPYHRLTRHRLQHF